MKKCIFILYFIVCLFICKFVNTEVYSSISRTETFLEKELSTVTVLERFVENEEKRLKSLGRAILEYKKTLLKGQETGLDNPVHTYIILKNVSKQWNDIYDLSKSNASQTFKDIKIKRKKENIRIPNEEELQMSRVGILRLQEIYDLNPTDIAVGRIEGTHETGEGFDANDCYKCASLYVADKVYYNGLRWIIEAVKRLRHEPDRYSKQLQIDILNLYSFTLYEQGNLELAYNVTLEIIELDPTNENFRKNGQLYGSRLNGKSVYPENLPQLKNVKPMAKNDSVSLNYQHYTLLCTGKAPLNKTMLSKLHCYYKKDRPFLQLAPVKVELVHIKPDIRLFRDVISDKEIDTLTSTTKNKLRRTTVGIGRTRNTSVTRTAQGAYVTSRETDIISKINKRLQDMTNLDVQGGENLQVINYGIGGHYNFHYDFFQQTDNESCNQKEEYQNNRIATVLFYLSTPKAGGATVFASLNLTLFPTKNDALFWYNLKKNGKPDFSTDHSGCPVISGTKWIANKWLHEHYQEFNRPCDLNEDE